MAQCCLSAKETSTSLPKMLVVLKLANRTQSLSVIIVRYFKTDFSKDTYMIAYMLCDTGTS